MTPLEQAALICLHYSMYCTLENMPLWLVGEWALGQELNPDIKLETADIYRAALEGMLAKGWLRVVDKTPEERLATLRAAGWIGPNPHGVPQKGDLPEPESYRTRLTVYDQAVAALREGILAWQSHRSGG